jgi:hypothetical protein
MPAAEGHQQQQGRQHQHSRVASKEVKLATTGKLATMEAATAGEQCIKQQQRLLAKFERQNQHK